MLCQQKQIKDLNNGGKIGLNLWDGWLELIGISSEWVKLRVNNRCFKNVTNQLFKSGRFIEIWEVEESCKFNSAKN